MSAQRWAFDDGTARTCWRSLDFWVALATLLLPFGFVLQVLRWEPIRARLFPSAGAPRASADAAR